MNVLLSCSGGMSSSLIAEAIKDEAEKNGITAVVDATGTEEVGDDLNNGSYDVVLLAPQAVYRKDAIEAEAKDHGVPFIMIPRDLYNPLGGPKLLELIQAELN
ncbi:PTS sugar transporter subunit IIB [Companilactobacillus sp. RD055328]|uniref:PTS sugar transporter subunit IIB n=1 Tax=Companilactobacillus sp. RD055328 TaxID=2916634 RepID=UPI001FC86AEE|nr:PTS fructose transporter subunit IIA [Companilactobacillus sp. RD055328]GKQ43444.1 PTS sugar transporter subunit IIB [Companilactobacillus sp. RD055328]